MSNNDKTKVIHTLVEDIYKLMLTKETIGDPEKAIDDFGEAMKKLMRKEFLEKREDKRTLRLSNIGREDRFLWNKVNVDSKEVFEPHTLIKFLYGNIIEELLLLLVKLSGHTVTHEQHPCVVGGVTGSMDCKIDGVVTDIKSTSTFGFKKFKDATLAYDDPFGYVAQIKAYAYSEGETKYGWLAMDKQNGHLTYLMYDEEDKQAPVYPLISYDILERVEHVKRMVEQPEAPKEPCENPLEDGKSGNMKLPVSCSYCHFKTHCFPELRGFLYSSGPRFLVKVEKEPNVYEIPYAEIK